ncbi:MAG: amidohydrolase [Pseudomonadota bacterium]
MKRNYVAALLIGFFAISCANDPNTASSNSMATDVYHNGTIITVAPDNPEVAAIAVRDGRILAIGSLASVSAVAGDNATLHDLQGATMLPGFIDAHGHISFTAFNQASANVSAPPVGQATNMDEVVSLLSQFAENNPNERWITGWGYDDSLLDQRRHPTRHDLDKVSTERPVAIRHVSGHFLACNTLCLERAGVNADTEDPQGGIFRREKASNQPDGVIEESAMAPVFAVMPEPDKARRLHLLKKAQDYYASYGVTTVQDGAAGASDIDLLREAASNGELFLDIVAYPYAAYMGEQLEQYTPTAYQDNFRIGGFKIVLDGSPQGKTAWLTKPYLHPPHGQEEGYLGYAILKDEQVQKYVELALGDGIQLLAHANGDAAADQLIDAISAAAEKFAAKDHRTVMIHAQTARDDQIDQMLALGMIPSYFSAHTFYWGDWHRDSVFGEERAKRISPLRTSADRGLRYTTHNDTPIVPPDMMRLWWASVNRITRSGKVLGFEQRATAMEALKSMTIDAAYQYREEDDKGSIEVGKMADLVILEENPFKVDSRNLKDITVLQTIKRGRSVYQR